MKIKPILLYSSFFLGLGTMTAQEKVNLSINEAVNMAWDKSNEVSLANTKVDTKKREVTNAKSHQYPDLKLTAQYQYLPSANINILSQNDSGNNSSGNPTEAPDVNQLGLAFATASLPVFSGFKIQNSIALQESLYQAETANALKTKENVALQTINYYTSLYKAQKTVELLEQNLKSAQQRVTDFNELEKNGIIPKNDLLKAQLQVSKIQLSVDEAKNNLSIVNYYLVTLLKMEPNTTIVISENDLAQFNAAMIQSETNVALENRQDLAAIRFQEKASEQNLKIAKSSYYPTITILGGYAYMNVKNTVEGSNLTNIGVGLSYDLGGLIKNGNNVKIAQNKLEEAKISEEILTDNIKIQVQKAIEDYNLAVSQDTVYQQAVEQATENYRLVKDKYDNGLADTNDLLEADVEQLSGQINKAVSKASIIQKYYELLLATGQISQSFNQTK